MKRKIMLIICSLVLTLSSVLPGFAQSVLLIKQMMLIQLEL